MPPPSSPDSASSQSHASPGRSRSSHEGWRETVESVVVAFLLAFLIRAFEAEAFVIPTGSMAPTLMGLHQDVRCAQCGFWYQAGTGDDDTPRQTRQYFVCPECRGHTTVTHRPASQPVECQECQRLFPPAVWREHIQSLPWLATFCPNCRYPNDLTVRPWFKGDRILVLKFPYAFTNPQRWDVVVFHFPEEANQNYIKRLVGIGPEELRIYWGDIYTRRSPQDYWRILRKPPTKQQVLAMPIYDNDHQPKDLVGEEWRRWQADSAETWVVEDAGATFHRDGGPEPAWLRYHHRVPLPSDWAQPAMATPQDQLITDFYAYNAVVQTTHPEGLSPSLLHLENAGPHWVGDLTLSFEVELIEPGGDLTCEFIEGIGRYQCRFDLSTGRATLWQQIWSEDGQTLISEQPLGEASTSLKGTGTHQVRLANVDDRLLMWIDDWLVDFQPGGEYTPPDMERLAERVVAENLLGQQVVILYPLPAESQEPSQTVRAALQRLERSFEQLGAPRPEPVPYGPDDRLDHYLRRRPIDTPVILLGSTREKREFLESLDEVTRRLPLRYYTSGAEWSWDGDALQPKGIKVVWIGPTPQDLTPVGIAASGATLRLRHLQVQRDVYYISTGLSYNSTTDYDTGKATRQTRDGRVAEFLGDPQYWADTFDQVRDRVFELQENEYLVLGDNSPRSKDSRLWHESGPAVDEHLLIGKAYFIYWPHGIPFWPNIQVGPWRVPFRPHVERMKFIR